MVMVLPKPTNLDELKQFLIFLQYYKQFINSFPEMSEIFYQVLESGEFNWCAVCETCYQLIDESLGDLFDDHQVFFFE